MNLASVKIRPRMVVLAVVFFFLNLFLITNYYYSHASVSATIKHYKSKLQGYGDITGENSSAVDSDGSVAAQNPLFEELFQSSGVEYEKYSIKYLPNYVSGNLNDKRSTLVLSLLSGSSPYGNNRQFSNFLHDVLLKFDEDFGKISLGLLCISQSEYKIIQNELKLYLSNSEIPQTKKFNRVSVIYAPFLDENRGEVNRSDRQQPWFQKRRRSLIAKSRNFLINSVLEFENYLLTIDSDIISISKKTLLYFIDSGKDIVVPRVKRGSQKDYDLNSWKGERVKPTPEELQKIREAQSKAVAARDNKEEYIFIPSDKPDKMQHLLDISTMLRSNKKSKKTEAVEIDSVGGAVLFLKSEIFKLGVQFPPYYVIGSDWDLPLGGYDGIETEGLCYQANILGFKCWAMPNLIAEHISD